MIATNTTELMNTLGSQARAASALMAKASSATKPHALRSLAALLRANVDRLQVQNEKDLVRVRAAGLAEPMVDRLKLTPKVIEICAQGCEQLAAMADIIGEISGLKPMPRGIRVGQMRLPVGGFGRVIARAFNVAREIDSGICHLNGPTVHDEAQMPFGGRAGIAEFTDLRWITVQTTLRHYPF
jgi:glutamate-5-semialdehyde dehydrogenase